MSNGEDHAVDPDGRFEGEDGEQGADTVTTHIDGLEREGRAWSGGRGFDESGYGYGAYGASDDG